jgi:hypothetical protein
MAALSSLIRHGYVTVYRGTSFVSEETDLALPAALREIQDKRFWDWPAPQGGTHLRVFAAPKGCEWYMSQPKLPSAAGAAS